MIVILLNKSVTCYKIWMGHSFVTPLNDPLLAGPGARIVLGT